jgi:hypothetical protein
MTSSAGGQWREAVRALPATVTELITRILNQFSLSSWIPGLVLTLTWLILGSVVWSGGDVTAALDRLSDNLFLTLVALTSGVLVTTTFTQAFEMTLTDALKGNWGNGLIGRRLAGMGIAYHYARKRRLVAILDDLENGKLFSDALAELVRRGELNDVEVHRVREARAGHVSHLEDDATYVDFAARRWREGLHPRDARVIDRLYRAKRDYPKQDFRIYPTLLGNIVAVSSEAISRHGASPRTFLQETYDVANLLQREQCERDQLRIDMYSTLCLVLWGTAIVWLPASLIGGVQVPSALLVSAALWVGGLLAYNAAVVAARSYRMTTESILRQIGAQSRGGG